MRSMTFLSVPRFARAFIVAAAVLLPALSLAVAGLAAGKAEGGALLTKDQWAKIAKRMDETGDVRILPFKVADHLGLTKGTETLRVHELAFEREGYQHGIYRSVDPADQRIILAFRTPEKKWTAFVTDLRFGLIAAIVWNAGETPVAWPNAEALPAFRNELGYWSVLADLM